MNLRVGHSGPVEDDSETTNLIANNSFHIDTSKEPAVPRKGVLKNNVDGENGSYQVAEPGPQALDHQPPTREPVDSLSLSSNRARSVSSLSHLNCDITTERGRDLDNAIKQAYKWKNRYDSPNKDFLLEMDKLFMDCQVHLSDISSQSNSISRREADALVEELIALRNHWGPTLLPLSVCNAFVRERIFLNIGLKHYRIDCAQFFEPIPFYNQYQNTGELMKLYRFSVYDLQYSEVIIRYFLERSNVIHMYHVLCFTIDGQRGQVHPYGVECPTYWDLRSHMISDLCNRFQNANIKL
jgi:hypothetical protein